MRMKSSETVESSERLFKNNWWAALAVEAEVGDISTGVSDSVIHRRYISDHDSTIVLPFP